MSNTSPRLRCAIYTRKSTEEGLDQEFNSLDAQREACAAFIASQVGLGWRMVPEHYDDGGISGGTMERPALQKLLQDIRDKKVDVVIVYKIDRLTRSLTDFSRIVEVFDASNVSFVSVTQQFNTTTSMGRLTLNVLLSFAQFEREVTAERIRDKIAASKKKGMWMGGTVPFGYRVENRKLVIDESAATEVRRLFRRYLELCSVPALATELNSQKDRDGTLPSLLLSDTGQGRRRPAKTVGRGKLYYMLSNPIYTGRIRHGSEIHAGEHRRLIDDDIFEKVQRKLAEQAPCKRGTTVHRDIHLLNGLLFDDTGDRLSPIHASKAGKRYRYCISSRLKAGRSGPSGKPDRKDGWRIPAHEIEAIILQQLKQLLSDEVLLADWLQAAGHACYIERALANARKALGVLEAASSPSQDVRAIVRVTILRIDLTGNHILRVSIDRNAIASWLAAEIFPSVDADTSNRTGTIESQSDGADRRSASASLAADDTALHVIDLPLSIRKRGVERRLVIEGQGTPLRRPDQALVNTIVRAHAYQEALTDGQGAGRRDVAHQFGVHPEDVSRLLPLAFLSPRIVEAILTGRQPADLTVRHLVRDIDLPINWATQGKLLGI